MPVMVMVSEAPASTAARWPPPVSDSGPSTTSIGVLRLGAVMRTDVIIRLAPVPCGCSSCSVPSVVDTVRK